MTTPRFTEIPPDSHCDCYGCVSERVEGRRRGWTQCGTAVARRRAAALVVLGGVSLTGLATAQAQEAQAAPALVTAPQALAAKQSPARSSSITRSEILARAQQWVNQAVPYSMYNNWRDGYRQDCSGFVSMAWKLGGNQWTGSLSSFADRISKNELKPGDILLFHNASNPGAGSHVVIFGGWTDSSRTHYTAYEQTKPHTVKRSNPYAYYNNSGSYIPYRYKNVIEDGGNSGSGSGGSGNSSASFPGAGSFGPGKSNAYITRLGDMLSQRGGAGFYPRGTGPTWTDDDRRATEAFQRAQGWTGSEADGIPGPHTWELLVSGAGNGVSGSGGSSGGGSSASSFPGAGNFGPGKSNAYITRLGEQLVKKGYGRHYSEGPGPTWSESDRRNVQAFQQAQGWTGRDADGYPGPETWRRLGA